MSTVSAYSVSARLGYDESCGNTDTESSMADNQQAMGQFLSDMEKRAYRIACIATGDSEEALDIVQDAMFKLVEKYQQHDHDQWPALFHCILQSRIRDWYRRNRVRRAVMGFLGTSPENDTDPFQEVEDAGTRSPEYNLEIDRSMSELDKALNSLPLRQQQAFLLRAWEGFDVRGTATAMSCSEGSVKTHYSRAVHKLRDVLGEHWQSGNSGSGKPGSKDRSGEKP